MRNFEFFLGYCKERLAAKHFSESCYMDAFSRIVNYTNNNQSGHYMTLFDAIYDFLINNQQYCTRINEVPFNISNHNEIFKNWQLFLDGHLEVKQNLPKSCGGDLQGGGGWSPTAKILFPVVAKYIIK